MRQVPASVQEYLSTAEFGGRFALADLVQSSVRNGRMSVELRLPDDLARLADKEAPATRPVRITLRESDLAWSLKAYGEAGARRTVALACYDSEALIPFQCVALHVGPGLVKVYAAGFDRPGIQPRLEITQDADGIAYSWTIPGQSQESGRVRTLVELRKKYPKFVQSTLSSVMRRVGLRGFVRRHPAGEVYGAFPDIPADPEAAAKLAALLPRLGAARPRDREAASAELDTLGRLGVVAVMRLDREALSPEQNTRLDAFLLASGEVTSDGPPPRHDIDFLVDCLDDDDRAVRVAARQALGQVLGREIDFDPDLTGDAREAAVDRLYEQLDRGPSRGAATRPSP